MSILVTGFEPFGSEPTNPSADIATALEWTRIGGFAVASAVLPVEFDAVGPAIRALLEQHRPALLLSLGLAAGTNTLRFERVAINLADARIPDNSGAQPVDRPLIPGSPTAYFSTLPVKAMAAAADQHAPSTLSFSAGSYVCNALMYHALHATAGSDCRAGFLHVPSVEDVCPAGATQAVQAALKAAAINTADVDQPGGTLY